MAKLFEEFAHKHAKTQSRNVIQTAARINLKIIQHLRHTLQSTFDAFCHRGALLAAIHTECHEG